LAFPRLFPGKGGGEVNAWLRIIPRNSGLLFKGKGSVGESKIHHIRQSRGRKKRKKKKAGYGEKKERDWGF